MKAPSQGELGQILLTFMKYDSEYCLSSTCTVRFVDDRRAGQEGCVGIAIRFYHATGIELGTRIGATQLKTCTSSYHQLDYKLKRAGM